MQIQNSNSPHGAGVEGTNTDRLNSANESSSVTPQTRQSAGGSESMVERYSAVELLPQALGPSLLGALFTVGGLLFEKGVDREALSAGVMGGLSSESGLDPAVIQFGFKALAMLLAEPSLEGFMKTGAALAQDPSFTTVLAKLVEVGMGLATKAAAASAG